MVYAVLYCCCQAIRSEYLKLAGIMFGWVEGTYPSDDTTIVVKFEEHLNLRNYSKWNSLNTLYFSQVIRQRWSSRKLKLTDFIPADKKYQSRQ